MCADSSVSSKFTQRQRAIQLNFSFVAFEYLMVKLSPSDPNRITIYAVSQLKCSIHI